MNNFSQKHIIYLKNLRKRAYIIGFFRIFILVGFIIIWELLTALNVLDSFITSSPTRIVKTLNEMFISSNMAYHAYVTFIETVIAFILSISIGLISAIILWWFNILNKILEPHLVIISALPKIALGPIIILWVGADQKAIIIMSLLISLIVTILDILNGFVKVEESKIKLLKTMHASKMQILTKLILPANIPTLLDTMKINVGLCWVGTIMGEYLVSSKGLGYLIVYGKQTFKLDLVMAATILLCIMAGIMYFAVEGIGKLIKRKFFF